MSAPTKRQRGLRILARDSAYVRIPVSPDEPRSERAVVPSFKAPALNAAAALPPAWHAFRRVDLRLPVDRDLVQAARALAGRAALPPDLVLQLARRRAVAQFRRNLEVGGTINLRPAPPRAARLRLTATFSDPAAQALAARFDPLATGRSYGLVAPLATHLADELERLVTAAASSGQPVECDPGGQEEPGGA